MQKKTDQLCFLNENSHIAVKSKKPIAIPKIRPFNLKDSSKERPMFEKTRKMPDKRILKIEKRNKERRFLPDTSKAVIIANPSGI